MTAFSADSAESLGLSINFIAEMEDSLLDMENLLKSETPQDQESNLKSLADLCADLDMSDRYAQCYM